MAHLYHSVETGRVREPCISASSRPSRAWAKVSVAGTVHSGAPVLRHVHTPWHARRNNASLSSKTSDRAVRMITRTMASDKTHVVNNLNQLLQLTDPVAQPVHRAPVNGFSRSISNLSTAVIPSKPRALAPLPKPVDQDNYHPSNGWRTRSHYLTKAQLWQRVRDEAAFDAYHEPTLATHLHSVILSHLSLEAALAFLLANKLADGFTLGSVQLMSLIRQVLREDEDIMNAVLADMHAVLDRDPACNKFTHCLLQFKGFHALETYRITHHLWNKGRQQLALALQSRVSELLQVDIHPAAQIGRGVMLDHATGVVIGETCVVGDNVSMLHHVSLGGSGTNRGCVRHPHIGHGVLLGAGVAVLGPVTVGAGSKVGAGSVVVTDLPDHCVAVGVPARIVKRNVRDEPIQEMDQCADFILDYVI